MRSDHPLKHQDWIAHFINFVGIGVSVLLGMWGASHLEYRADQQRVDSLLKDFQIAAGDVIEKLEDTQIYFGLSEGAGRHAVENWETLGPDEFLYNLYRSSQIINAPPLLNYYSDSFSQDGLAKISDESLRIEVTKFFSFRPRVFELEDLGSDYRTMVREFLPLDYQTLYRETCGDIPESKSSGIQHKAGCLPNLISNASSEGIEVKKIANTLRDNMATKRALTHYISELSITQTSLFTYRCNTIVFSNEISKDTGKSYKIPENCDEQIFR